MRPSTQGGGLPHHRARLFPLPFLPSACRPPCHSARNRHRFKVKRTIVAVTNRCIFALNRLYSSPSFQLRHPPHRPFPSQPDIPFSVRCPSVAPESISSSSSAASAAQSRVLAHLRERCASFVTTVRAWCSHSGSARDIVAEVTADHMISAVWEAAADASASPSTPPPTGVSHRGAPGPFFSSSLSSYSSCSTSVVPLVASRVSLPDELRIVPLERVLPPAVFANYRAEAESALLRPADELLSLNAAKPLSRPRVAGRRAEYVLTVGRMHAQGMISFTSAPRAVNGAFTVRKDDASDRLVIDAQPANRLFADPPRVDLPNPSHLVQMQLPADSPMFVAKSDLSNFYHHLGLPVWLQPFFALPPLTAAELSSIGAPVGGAFPICVTMPMGWSHAVYLAQSAHEHVLYGSGALSRSDSLLTLSSPTVTATSCLHGIVIDDFFIFSLSAELSQRVFDGVLAAYRRAGFVVKQSKVVAPTLLPVKVIGFDIDGRAGSIALPAASQLGLMRDTLSLLVAGRASSMQLARLIGRWTWLMLLRRPSLAVLQHVYKFIRVDARGRNFTLWKSVRRELCMLLGLQPLLCAQLREPLFQRVIASDASSVAAGVVATTLTPDLHERIWPLCSSRQFAALQAQLNTDSARRALSEPDSTRSDSERAALRTCMATFQEFYEAVAACRWSTLVSKAWLRAEHINALELRAALLAVHWTLSFPSALGRRVYLLLDSTVALFSLWKGRSSSPTLLLILRGISALLLAGGISLLCGWLPSAFNPADAPSRAFDPGPGGRTAAP